MNRLSPVALSLHNKCIINIPIMVQWIPCNRLGILWTCVMQFGLYHFSLGSGNDTCYTAKMHFSLCSCSQSWNGTTCTSYITINTDFYFFFGVSLQSPPKDSIHLRQSQVLKIEGRWRKSRGCTTPTIELVHTGPIPVLKFQKMASQELKVWGNLSWEISQNPKIAIDFQAVGIEILEQLNGGFGTPPTFHLAPLSFEYSARQKCILSFGGDCMLKID